MKKNYISSTFRKFVGLFQKNLLLRKMKVIMYYFDEVLLFFIKTSQQVFFHKLSFLFAASFWKIKFSLKFMLLQYPTK